MHDQWDFSWLPTDEEVCRAIRAVPVHRALTNVASGCTKVSKLLNAVGAEATLWVVGQDKIGINIFGVTGTITLTIFGSVDGIKYDPVSVMTYPATVATGFPIGGVPTTGNLPTAAVTTATANAQFELLVGNLQFVRVQQTAGTGTAKVIIAASVDGSYQEAFQTPTNLGVTLGVVYPSTTSSGGVNTMTIPAVVNAAINLTFLDVEMAGPGFGANAQLRIWDGAIGVGTPLFSSYLTGPVGSVGTQQVINLPKDSQGNVGIQGTPGNAMNIQIVNLGSTSAIMNARYSFQ